MKGNNIIYVNFGSRPRTKRHDYGVCIILAVLAVLMITIAAVRLRKVLSTESQVPANQSIKLETTLNAGMSRNSSTSVQMSLYEIIQINAQSY